MTRDERIRSLLWRPAPRGRGARSRANGFRRFSKHHPLQNVWVRFIDRQKAALLYRYAEVASLQFYGDTP